LSYFCFYSWIFIYI